jgi:electron transfer flavoprotein beta subunit
MDIAVCVKRVGSIEDDIEFSAEHDNVDSDYLDFELNEWDATATAEALRLRDLAGDGIVTVLTVGDSDSTDVLVQCLAMGADQAIRIDADVRTILDPLSVGRLLGNAIRPLSVDFVLCGAQSADSAQGATPGAVAAVLEFPCATVVTRIQPQDDGAGIIVERELEGGLINVLEILKPGVLSIQTGTAEPRYVSFRAIQEAQEREITVLNPMETEVGEPGYRIRRMDKPTSSRAELISGGPRIVAERILTLVKDAIQ